MLICRTFGGLAWQLKMKLVYRSHMTLHQIVNDYIINALPFFAFTGYLFVILGGFTVFRNDNYVFRTLILLGSLIIICTLGIVFPLAYQITSNSSKFLHSFKLSTAPKNAVDKRIFKSFHPIYVDLSRCCRITRNTFPSVMHDIIINALITLLLTIPDTTP